MEARAAHTHSKNTQVPPPPLRDGYPPKTDTSLLRTVSFVPGQRKLLPVAEPDLQVKGEVGAVIQTLR